MKKINYLYEEAKAWISYFLTAQPAWVSVGIGILLTIVALVIVSKI